MLSMRKNNPIIKTFFIVIILAALAYFGLDISKDDVTHAVDTYLPVVLEKADIVEGVHQLYTVATVIDGDTFTYLENGATYTVRVLGINTPETKYASRGEECFGAQASRKAKELLSGTQVSLQTDNSQDTYDAYNRLLAYVTLASGADFGELMIREGYAYEYTFKNPYLKQGIYKSAAKTAQETSVGLWSVCRN